MPPKKDYTGIKTNMLTAIKPDPAKKGYWIFECECGVQKSIRVCNVLSGDTKSCGCLNRTKIHEPKNRKDLSGALLGKLEVKEVAYVKNNELYYLCKCKCGNETIVRGSQLTSGRARSCGCDEKRNQLKNVTAYHDKNRALGTNVELCSKTEPNINNKLGVRGVWYNKTTNRYVSYISFMGKQKVVGKFENLSDAIKARECAVKERNEMLQKIKKEQGN